MTSIGMKLNCSKFLAQTPRMNPNRQKVVAVSSRNTAIQKGCSMCTGTKRFAVARITMPRMTDLVAAAPT